MSRADDAAAASSSEQQLLAVAKGGGFLALGNIFNYGGRLAIAAVLARVLGASDYGLYTLAVTAAYLLSGVANLGLDAAMERYVAVLRRRGDRPGVQGTLQLGVVFSLIGALTVCAVVYFAAEWIAVELFDERRLTPLLRVVAFIVPLLVSTTLLSAIVRGFKRMGYSALSENVVQPLVRLALTVVFAIVGLTPQIALVIFGISYAAASLLLVGFVQRLFPLDLTLRSGRRATREIVGFSFPFWFAGILTQVRRNIQPVLLGIHSTTANVGVFSLASSANLLGSVAIMSIRTSLRPTLAETLDAGDRRETQFLYRSTTRWTLSANLPVFLVMFLFPSALLALFGRSFEVGGKALRVLALAELANAATGTCGAIIDMSGFNRVKVVNKIFEVTLTLVLNLVLIYRYGLMGAAAAAALSTLAIQLVRVVEVRVLVGIHPYDRATLKPITAAVVAGIAGIVVDRWLPASEHAYHLVVDSAVVVATFVAVLTALGLSPEDRAVAAAVFRRRPSRKSGRST